MKRVQLIICDRDYEEEEKEKKKKINDDGDDV